MFTISASRLSVRFVAFITVVSLIMSAFPASFFVANAQVNDPIIEGTTDGETEELQETAPATQSSEEPGLNERKPKEKPMVCHANNSNENANNPFNPLPLDQGQGHSGHEGDIIPVTEGFPQGQNLATVYPQFGGLTGQQILNNDCEVPEPAKTVTVNAAKIICTDEAELPNWGNGGPDITSTTAADWVKNHKSCSFAKGWEFQWGNQSAPDYGDTTLGAAPSYTTFTNSTVIPINDVSEIHLREVLQSGYLPFSHEANPDNSNAVSAEFYCANDVLNYDNWDFIRNPKADQTYYCVAWNVPVAGDATECKIGENLIDNGGFEEETVTANGGQWQIFATVAGWVVGLSDGLEIWNTFNGTNNDVAAEGKQNAELDGNDATSITQTVATTPGATYELSYAYSPRAGTVLADSKMEALINDAIVATDNTDGSAATANTWQSKSYSFVATGTTTKVSFRDAGVANANGGYGPLLDGVALCKTKEAPRCELKIVSDTQTLVEDTNTLAVATYSGHSAWTASIPGATWIWETATVTDPVNATTRTFIETFTITAPTSASLTIAADNGYQVYLNNVLVVDNLAVENNFQLGTQDVIPLTLASGANTLKVVVKNFPQAGGTYKSNPAGLLFKLTAVGTTDCGRTTDVVKTGPVTMCKVDAKEKPLAGWTMTLLGNKVEDVVVPANTAVGVNTAAILTAGKSYVAKASGTWDNNRGPLNVVDAEYSTEDSWATQMDGFTGFPTDILELSINNVLDPASKWGTYNSAHTYAQAFTQAANGTAKFHVADTFYGDNTGSLNVAVYEGFAGITGENGCVTFQDVPFGTYTAGEIMQDNWTNISGLGEVKVSKKNNKFTLVNKFEPKYTDETIEIDVTGNTTNLLTAPTSTGWYFDSITPFVAPYAFQTGNASRDAGSLFAGPVGNVGQNKFIGTYQGFWPVKTLKSIAYDFKIASNTAADENEFYLNIYANFGASAPTKFYDCRYDVVPTTGSLSSFTTVNYDVTDAKLAQQSGSSPFACPATLAEMETVSAGAVVRAIALNVGDTGTQDTGVSGYFDNVVVKTQDDTLYQKKTTIFDFEPAPVVGPTTFTVEGYKYECNLDGEYYCYNGYEGWLITATMGSTSTSTRTNEDGYYSFELPAGVWTISEESREDWEQVYVEENGEDVEASVCELAVGLKKPSLLARVAELVWEPEYTCDFGNYYDEDEEEYTETISGFKWNDLDGNGVRNGEEPTLANWVIALYDGELLVATTTTNGAGYYSFEVGTGDWTVVEVQQSGWTQTGTIRNNVALASTTKFCEFDVYNYELSRSSVLDTNENDWDWEENYTCDFGNKQEQVVEEEPEEPQRNGSSGTRTKRAPQGQVLGAATQCGLWLEDYMQKATENDTYQVLKLQVFLNLQGFATPLTGIFDAATEANVKLFQTKYADTVIKPWFDRGIVPHNRPTGFVYKTTRWQINEIMCPGIEPYPSFDGENLSTNVLISR